MAGAAGTTAISAVTTTATAAATPFPAAYPLSKKTQILSSSLPSSFPSRYKRTNQLRKKILKTLENRPYPDPNFPAKTQKSHTEEAIQELGFEADRFSVSERTSNSGFFDGIASNFESKSFAKIGMYLVGAFVFQTVCAVLIFGFNEIDDKDDNFIRNGDNGIEKDSVKSDKVGDFVGFSNRGLVGKEEGGGGLVDEGEMNDRIVEIREMAREARKQEKIEAKRNGVVEDGDDEVDLVEKNVKQKEVDGRLMKLRKRFEGDYEKLPGKVFGKEGDVGDDGDKGGLDVGEEFGSLMFKKKYKYKSPSVDSGDKPQGFGGTTDNDVIINGVNANDGTLQMEKKNECGTGSDDISSGNVIDIFDNSKEIDLPSDKGLEISVVRDDDKEQERRATNIDSIDGTSNELKDDKQANNPLKSGKSSNLERRKPRGFGKGSQENTAVSNKQDVNKNGGLKGKKGVNNKSARTIEEKSSTQTGFWWTSLPYVMAVLMQRGGESGESEESEGLFTLRGTSQTRSGLSHTVAFEDRNDATKFCYLLESFFEDLGDFYTNIIPIPTNELEEAVKSQIMNVIVVKKGQLQLYVGRPLTEVESALRVLIQQSEKL